jgi:molybdate transport system substrate-binding protein
MRILFCFLLLFSLAFSSRLTVAVAANASYAMEEIKTAFLKSHPDTEFRIVVGSSGKLTAQIRHGAPYDLFLSADMDYPASLHRAGLAPEPPRVYALGALALMSVEPRELKGGLALLADPFLRRIALPNPRTAPYGRAAMEALKKSGLYPKVRDRLIFGESVAQTVAYTLTAAEVGIVARSVLYSPRFADYREGRRWIGIPPDLYTPIRQGALLLRRVAENESAREFYDFLFGTEAREIFHRYGYLLP